MSQPWLQRLGTNNTSLENQAALTDPLRFTNGGAVVCKLDEDRRTSYPNPNKGVPVGVDFSDVQSPYRFNHVMVLPLRSDYDIQQDQLHVRTKEGYIYPSGANIMRSNEIGRFLGAIERRFDVSLSSFLIRSDHTSLFIFPRDSSSDRGLGLVAQKLNGMLADIHKEPDTTRHLSQWEQLANDEEGLQARAARDMMGHAVAISHTSPMHADGTFHTNLPSVVTPKATRLNEQVLPFDGISPMVGSKGVVVWLNRDAYNAHGNPTAINNEKIESIAKPAIRKLMDKFSIPLYSFSIAPKVAQTNESQSHCGIVIFTDKKHQQLLSNAVLKELQKQFREARNEKS